MNECKRKNIAAALMLLLAFSAETASAANRNDPNKQAMRRMQNMVKQAQDEKAAVEQEKADLQKNLDDLKKKSTESEQELKRASRVREVVQKELDKLKQEYSELNNRFSNLEQQLAEKKNELNTSNGKLRTVSDQKAQLEQDLANRSSALSVCQDDNRKLYRYQVEMINRAQRQGSLEVLLEKEPVLGLKRVEIENLLEKYRDQVDCAQVGAAPCQSASK